MHLLLLVWILLVNIGCDSHLAIMGEPRRSAREAVTEVFALSTLKATEGDVVKVSGINLRPGMTVEIEGQSVLLDVDSPSSASFIMPKSTKNGSIGALFKNESKQNVGYLALVSSESNIRIPVMDADPALICSDITFQNSTGQLKVGARNCSSGATVCTKDGEASCVTTASYLAVDVSKLEERRSDFSKDLTLAGIKGTLPKCTKDNEDLCITSPEFPSVIKALITPGLVKSGSVIAGISGAYPSLLYPLASDTAMADLTAFETQLTTDDSFEFFDSFGTRHTASGDSDLNEWNLGLGVILENLSLQGTISYLRPPAIEPVNQLHTSIQLRIQEQCCYASGFLVVRRLGSPVSWTPSDGDTYTVGTDLGGGQTVVAFSSLTSFTDTGLLAHSKYHYQAWSYDGTNIYSTDGNRLETFTYPGANFIVFDYLNHKWLGRRGSLTPVGLPAKPSMSSNRLELTMEGTNNASIASPIQMYATPFNVDFDYRTSRDAADGFSFTWGKNITEYESSGPRYGQSMGLLHGSGASGYALKFNIFGAGSLSLVRLSDDTVLTTVAADIDTVLNTDRHVKIEFGHRSVDVYLFGSTTATLSYTNPTDWQTGDRSVVFGAATGGSFSAFSFSDIQIVQVTY